MTIDSYTEQNKGDFEKIWVDWLTNTMGVRPQEEDLLEVQNPVEHYIKTGGMAYYANRDGHCMGIVAVKKLNKTDYEFCKLVVAKQAQGMGIGKKLVRKCIGFAREQGGQHLYLQTFNKLEIALKMYRSMGFTNAPAPKGMFVVKRTEIIMKKSLQS
ncbi:GNAT family N-acetyltransferase [Muricauda sp. MAR_2010_75]|jgi:ribosomal protein S18 acetylase RimI-like enzyme|uniref:GNAT family N-acetyltransferase n=1 Tax=Allomuricauda sp. MAR_2010_75 TaxID=1250232 RepID=UPI00055FE01D|nr:GNAT family N-acetyltransferase [Muricauda sp. MAR_2010_75]